MQVKVCDGFHRQILINKGWLCRRHRVGCNRGGAQIATLLDSTEIVKPFKDQRKSYTDYRLRMQEGVTGSNCNMTTGCGAFDQHPTIFLSSYQCCHCHDYCHCRIFSSTQPFCHHRMAEFSINHQLYSFQLQCHHVKDISIILVSPSPSSL